MEIILQEDIPSLGKAGEVVRVKDGYGRNFLLPRKKAVLADRGNLRELEHHRRQATARQAKICADAGALAQRLAGTRLTFRREAGPDGKLFGSVTAADIAQALVREGFAIDRRQLRLTEPIRQVGEHAVAVRLPAEVVATIRVVVETQA